MWSAWSRSIDSGGSMVTNGIACLVRVGEARRVRCALRVCDDLGREADSDVELTAELGESGLDLGVVGVGQAEPALRHRLRVRRDRLAAAANTEEKVSD